MAAQRRQRSLLLRQRYQFYGRTLVISTLITYYGWPVLSDEKFFIYRRQIRCVLSRGDKPVHLYCSGSGTVLKPAIDEKKKTRV